ncbi:vanin-like protein 2 [Photinus pyralis]|nr:vanin-like protein 2 [Photinus pyralis]
MVAFSGTRTFARVSNGGIEVCAVVACLNDSLSSCGKRFRDYNTVSWPTTFKKIVIEAEFDEDPNKFQFPNSLLSNIEPIHVDDFEWRSILGNKRVRRTYLLKKPQNRLMTFGIYGRDFNRDSLA